MVTQASDGLDWGSIRGIMFVCHGNICRSVMAECVMSWLLDSAGLDVRVASSATSMEELGNPVYPPARAELRRHGVPVLPHHAVQLRRDDVDKYDLFIGADSANVGNMLRILGQKAEGRCFRLLDFTDMPRDIADPWYTGGFSETWDGILEGCQALLAMLLRDGRD